MRTSKEPPRAATRGFVVDENPQKNARRERVIKTKVIRRKKQIEKLQREIAELGHDDGKRTDERVPAP